MFSRGLYRIITRQCSGKSIPSISLVPHSVGRNTELLSEINQNLIKLNKFHTTGRYASIAANVVLGAIVATLFYRSTHQSTPLFSVSVKGSLIDGSTTNGLVEESLNEVANQLQKWQK